VYLTKNKIKKIYFPLFQFSILNIGFPFSIFYFLFLNFHFLFFILYLVFCILYFVFCIFVFMNYANGPGLPRVGISAR